MKKQRTINPQLKIENNFTGEVFDVPVSVYETYGVSYLFNKQGQPKFTIIETAAQFMDRINATPKEPGPETGAAIPAATVATEREPAPPPARQASRYPRKK